ncbi:HNH endonuclease [Ramlibacter montanisoli]|uniref:HNH endonuclease n=1 Tax=Ramlibacter montanisoli TaxID=2732512 RepID=UPI001C0E9181|nr:HNH endonuclease signature motif containing protein [Ramlibacter montanisoli]
MYVGYMKDRMWNSGHVLGYRFAAGTPEAANACPTGFDLEMFSRRHGCDADAFFVRKEPDAWYLRVCDVDIALELLLATAARIDEQIFGGDADSSTSEVEQDLDQIRGRADIPATTRDQLVLARVGQGKFRRDLERVFKNRCAATGLGLRQALRASHVLPWRSATDEQRLDPNNGLLLSANLDALFDKHLVSFDREGTIRVSPLITVGERLLLGPLHDLAKEPSAEQWHYLEQHNAAYDESTRRREELDDSD